MIRSAKVSDALHALHRILVQARWLTGEGAEPQKLYKILDRVEILPMLIFGQEQDTTQEFREILADLGNEFPEFAGCLSAFDEGDLLDASSPPTSLTTERPFE